MLAKIHLLFPERRQGEEKKKKELCSYKSVAREETLVLGDTRRTVIKLIKVNCYKQDMTFYFFLKLGLVILI